MLNEFLPATIGAALPRALISGQARLWTKGLTPFIPVEFQGAAYRFGHSQVRPSYRVNFTGAADGGQKFAFVFDPSQIGAADPTDMQGGIAGPGRHIGWPTFFNFGDDRAQFTRNNKRSTRSCRRRSSICRRRRSAGRRTSSRSPSATSCAT